jgi:hypothetical protein
MSCRTTKGGTLAHRLARATSGLSDKTVQSLFHALKREGENAPNPTVEEVEEFRNRMRTLMAESNLSAAQLERSEHDLFLSKDEVPDGSTFYSWSAIEARARQEAVLRSVKAMVVDLDPPGSQSEYYTLGADGRPENVWYASYGSNLDRARFMTYIAGGTPDGSATEHEGARDKTEPEEDVAIRYEGRMHFAGVSGRWGGGGVAFIDNDTAGHALGRAYMLKMEQFDDVVAQENGRTPGTLSVDTEKALAEGKSEISHGFYGTLVHIGDYKCAPVFTFTGDFSAKDAVTAMYDGKKFSGATNSPSDNYIRMIGSGLSETFGMDTQEQADYLRGSLGADKISRDEVVRVLSTPPDPVAPKKVYKSKYSGSSSTYGSSRHLDTYGDSWYEEARYRDTLFDDPWIDDTPSGSRGKKEKNWWEFDTESEFEEYLADSDLETYLEEQSSRTAYSSRVRCGFCGEYGHRMNDCHGLGIIGYRP